MGDREQIDTVVIGAGQAGLAMSRWLQKLDVPHVVLERRRVADSWAQQRWDSFFLNTIHAINRLPDDAYEGESPAGFPSRDEFVQYLRDYRTRHDLPVREGVEVTRLRKSADGFEVEAGDARLSCRRVVLCSGDQNEPSTPAAGADLPDDIARVHAADYRRPDALPDGAVLVVGSGQSGVQIVEDLLDAGREVYLCTSRVGRVPRRYRGRDVLEWMMQIGMHDHRPADLQDPNELHARQPQISGAGGGHSVSCHQLARAGATLLGRLQRVGGRVVHIGDDLLANVEAGDMQATKVRAGIDMFIDKAGVDAPAAEPDPVDEPFAGLVAMAERRTLDLDEAGIRSVVLCTGFRGRFDYLDPELRDARGQPRHREGVGEAPGLYCLGFTWLRRRFSGLVGGVSGDAERIASLITAGTPSGP